ncbi:hypothetical protein G3475_05775 [Shewanella baltica]|nr:hypothetical protein [Shewanella baltica]MCS6208556.1 hypothetical protein [Shewanella baltica]MCS6254534.1 hypothetical protein [Shewanella baltica]
MVISETTVRPMDGAVEHPRMDSLRVVEQIPWIALLYLTFFYPKMNCMGIQPRLYYIIKTARSGINESA